MEEPNYRDHARRSWEKLLDVESLRFSLVICSIFLTAYEMLNQALIDRLRSFFAKAWTRDGPEISDRYREVVLSRHEMPYYASADWFLEMGALEKGDLSALRAIRDHRNFVAHNIPKIVMDASVDVDVSLLGEITRIVARLDRWWLREVEIPTNPDFDGSEVSEEDLAESFSTRMMTLQLLIRFAAGDEDQLRELHTAFAEVWPPASGSESDSGGA